MGNFFWKFVKRVLKQYRQWKEEKALMEELEAADYSWSVPDTKQEYQKGGLYEGRFVDSASYQKPNLIEKVEGVEPIASKREE